MMTRTLVCKICLSTNVNMYRIRDSPLSEIYEKLTDLPFVMYDGKPDSVCYQCVARLRSCWRLRQLAMQTDRTLTKLLNEKLPIEEDTLSLYCSEASHRYLSVALLEVFHLTDSATDIKVEETNVVKIEPSKDDVETKQEEEEEINNTPRQSDVEMEMTEEQRSDSEDDLPLKSISREKSNKPRVRQKKVRKREKTESNPGSIEITLSREQQTQELMLRATSLNYLNAPYKCTLCYKGFAQAQPYRNHCERHEQASGDHECQLCKLRYRSARHLRMHATAAHERRYVCTRCRHRSNTRNQALVHERWHDGHTYPCKICGQVFSRPTTYLSHVRKLHASEHVCVVCGRGFVGARGLLMHTSKAHQTHEHTQVESSEPADKRLCRKCGIEFASCRALASHVLTSVQHKTWKEDSEECAICGVRVPPERRREHTREHARAAAPAPAAPPPAAPLAPLPCDQCQSTFRSHAKLAEHVRRVHLGLRYNAHAMCDQCGKKFTSYARFHYHTQSAHAGARPHACAECGARFAWASALRVHARRHTGERPYACAECDKRFSQKPALNRHRLVHTGAKPHQCRLCLKRFTQSNSLKLHVSTVHLKMTRAHPRRRPARPPATPRGQVDGGDDIKLHVRE